MDITIALAGNPNSGKSTLFNELTGARQHVGNYPGVTVEKKEGLCTNNGNRYVVVDLPGVYSLTAYSLEEVVARDYLINEKPTLIVNIVDASNLDRNLYLTLQFMEMGLPLCIALNMMDVAKGRGIQIDVHQLERLLGVPVAPMVARRGTGKQALLEAAQAAVLKGSPVALNISYGPDIDPLLKEMEEKIIHEKWMTGLFPARWVALKYLEQDEQILGMGRSRSAEVSTVLEAMVQSLASRLKKNLETYPAALIADHRYGYIKAILKEGVTYLDEDRNRIELSGKIDRVLTHRFLGPVIMVLVLMGLYHFTFTYSAWPIGAIEGVFGWLSGVVDAGLPEGLLKSLVISGIIDGAGGVIGFTPLILFMFLGVAILEDSGYLARVAYMLDRIFRIFGLHGSSVMPFIISGGIAGGCAVPGIMATRTLKSPKERLATLLTVPFMNCGAKLPVFALLVAAFFSKNQALMMGGITLIAWMGALLVAKLLRTTLIRGESAPFVMELPPYRFPTFKGVLIHTWERTRQYIKKAGTVILGISILLWAMMRFPALPNEQKAHFQRERASLLAKAPVQRASGVDGAEKSDKLSPESALLKERVMAVDGEEAMAALKYSVAGRIGSALETVTLLAGFDWRANIALLGGFAAKEVVVSTLGTAYSLGEVDPEEATSLSDTLAKTEGWTPLSALSLIIFTLFYAPCFVAVVCLSREAGSWRWGVFSILFNTAIAFSLAVIVFQTGSFFGY